MEVPTRQIHEAGMPTASAQPAVGKASEFGHLGGPALGAAASPAERFAPPAQPSRRSEITITYASVSLTAILLAALLAVGYWSTLQHEVDTLRATTDRGHALAEALAPGAELLLAHDDLSGLRRILTETARTQNLSEIDVVLPDGRVLAASTPSRITDLRLPERWADGTPPPLPTSATTAAVVRSLHLGDRGVVYLRLAVAQPDISGRQATTLAFVGMIGIVGFVGTFLVHRHLRRRLRAISAVRAALLSLHAPSGNNVGPVLVNANLGPEAAAWNALMAERDLARREALTEKALEVFGRKRQGRSDLDAACDAMSHGLLLIDEAGLIRYANGAAATFLSADRDALSGVDLSTVLQVESVTNAVRQIVTGVSRKRTVVDVERRPENAPAGKTADGKAAPANAQHHGVLRFSVRPVRKDDAASAMVVIEDITQQKAAEEARHAFVAQATHELRTPLTNIRLYVESAIEDGEADPAIRVQALNVINSESRRLERVVGEMLSVAEIEAGAFKLKTDDVRLDALFDELKHDYQQQALEKKQSLTFLLPPKLPVLIGDRDKVAIAVHNLIGNAIKYTPTGGSITVRVDADEKQLNVAVADTGIGISPENCQRVFERFFRADDGRVGKITGSGLGLTIAREVARLHGGDITVESQLNKGSTFTLALPVKAAA